MHWIEPGVGVLHLGLVGYSTQAFKDRDPFGAVRVEDPNVPQAAVKVEDRAHPRLGQAPRAGTILTSMDILVRQLDPPLVSVSAMAPRYEVATVRKDLPGWFKGG
ncbi:hypothetical protein [Streptomyces xanthophaeus]|uniref:hypothetical protein n=1 Tax=Streptomyces xanthophaeus TaxID=67385 RepID=UPI003648FE52